MKTRIVIEGTIKSSREKLRKDANKNISILTTIRKIISKVNLTLNN
jgi:hypothetical protein